MLGAEGILKKDRIMASLREAPPDRIGGQAVRRVLDFWDEQAFGAFVSDSDRMPRNVIQLQTDGFIVTIRPSGTEPKLKLYCQLLPDPDAPAVRGHELLQSVRERADEVARQIYADLLGRIDVTLGTPALLLPDIVDLDRKIEFEQKTVGALRESLLHGSQADLAALLEWLGDEVSAMTPGTDALPAVKAPVKWLAKLWRDELDGTPLLDELAAWAAS
jgi:hypothetical protein